MDWSIRTLMKAATVSIVWGAIATFCMLLITSTYLAAAADGQMVVVTGIDALRSQINAFGYTSYFKTFFGIHLIVAVTIFVGCLIYGKWALTHKNHDT
jgi:hypothetical protein